MGSIAYASTPPPAAELVIVGGGVVGAATAFYAARAGIEVVVLERRPAPATLTTPASTGAFRLQFDNLEELEIVRESAELFLNFAEITGQDEYDLNVRRQGYLWVTTDPARLERQRRLVEQQHSWGQTDIELLAGDEVRARWPYVSEDVVQARWRAGDGFLEPKRLTMGLLAASGCTVVTNCAVTGFEVGDGRLTAVLTSAGPVSTRSAVIAAGPFSGVVASGAGLILPIETVARHKVVVPEMPLVPPDAPMTIDEDTGAHWRPAYRGAALLFTDPTTPPSEPTEDVPPDHRRTFGLLDPSSPAAVARVAPFWKEAWGHNGMVWMVQSGQYTMTPDHRPLLGETEIEGLHLNTGYSGHGIMGSPAGSRHLVDVLTGRIASADNAFRPDRVFEERELDVL